MSDPIEGYKIAASLLGGGAVGAIITALVTSYRNRIRSVSGLKRRRYFHRPFHPPRSSLL